MATSELPRVRALFHCPPHRFVTVLAPQQQNINHGAGAILTRAVAADSPRSGRNFPAIVPARATAPGVSIPPRLPASKHGSDCSMSIPRPRQRHDRGFGVSELYSESTPPPLPWATQPL